MVRHTSLLVALVQLVDRIPLSAAPPRRGRPPVYSDRLFLKALVIMIVRHLFTVHALLAVLDEPTPEMRKLRILLTEEGRYPSRRTWERRLAALPATLPAQIGCLGRHLVTVIQPWEHSGRAAASGTRSIGRKERSPIPPSIPRRTGPRVAGMARSTGGSSISRRW